MLSDNLVAQTSNGVVTAVFIMTGTFHIIEHLDTE